MGAQEGAASKLARAGGWKLGRQAGSGGSSVVFEGERDAVRGAVKILDRGFDLGEATLLARLGRRWGPRLLDAGRCAEQAFVVTEWVDGVSLDGARGEPKRIWAALHAVARALEELHEAGVRHGDVKPENILFHERVPSRDVPEERAATLIDLGLATDVGEVARGGTARYAAPELRGGGDVGPRADVFALGVVIEELLGAKSAAELASLARAMQAPSPGARPRAGWLADRAARALGLVRDASAGGRGRLDAVRRSYVALRAREIARASSVSEEVAGAPRAWLEEAIGWTRKTASAEAEGVVGRSSALARSRWLVSLVGPAAAEWPLPDLDENGFASRVCALAERSAFGAWTYADFRGAENGSPEVDVEDEAALALALAKPPPSAELVAAVEARGSTVSSTLREALVAALVRA
ncbi:MAG TPA: lipopolysaccharide kinase InaA family protein, partial [Polyangiaceae bacterium]